MLSVDRSLVVMRSALRLYLGKVRGIYRYGSVSGKHDSFTDAETVDGLSYLSLEVYEQIHPGRNMFQHIAPSEGPSTFDLALFTHAPISELVYHLNGAAILPLSNNGDGLFKLSAGDDGYERWCILNQREHRIVLRLDHIDGEESAVEEEDYDEAAEGSKKRKPKPPRGAVKRARRAAEPRRRSGAQKNGAGKATKGAGSKKNTKKIALGFFKNSRSAID
ncbi:hypothetical protein GGX14DRAFT_391869 [Mycena pura]|uniref:Uncharacterized protein n=1 Tax=Mycena pura TaxID=153505 RepID=A0AAD6YI64_9AGAR|nr:hypothetical protein GGX14DRAFT_391869 [Mycena pura]